MAMGKITLATRRRRRARKTNQTTSTIARRVVRSMAEKKNVSNLYETKVLQANILAPYIDQSTVISRQGVHFCLAQGDTAQQRNGAMIRLQNYQGKYQVYLPDPIVTAGPNPYVRVRVCILGLPSDIPAVDIFPTDCTSGAQLVDTPVKYQWRKYILMDKIATLQNINSFQQTLSFNSRRKRILQFVSPIDQTPDKWHINAYLMATQSNCTVGAGGVAVLVNNYGTFIDG